MGEKLFIFVLTQKKIVHVKRGSVSNFFLALNCKGIANNKKYVALHKSMILF